MNNLNKMRKFMHDVDVDLKILHLQCDICRIKRLTGPPQQKDLHSNKVLVKQQGKTREGRN